MINGYFSFVLHAHLPYVRHPEHELFLEELWFFEALSETYLPLLRVFHELNEKKIQFPITISISPTLIEMLNDSLLKERFIRYLEDRIVLCEKEIIRTKNIPKLSQLAHFYLSFFKKNLHDFINIHKQNLIESFKQLKNNGQIELWTTSATHCNLSLFSHEPWIVKAQIKIGISTFEKYFGFKPNGFWLPECSYFKGLDQILKDFHIDLTILDSHSFLFGNPRPLSAVYLPVKSMAGVSLFSRDLSFSQQIWSNDIGYPGASAYREFYSDLAYELTAQELSPCVHPDGFTINTGIKYKKITDKRNENKKYYHRQEALNQVNSHSYDLIGKISHMTEKLCAYLNPPPLITAPFDAELFGHWWFEGPDFLKTTAIQYQQMNPSFQFIHLNEYHNRFPIVQKCEPSPSSWGKNGYSEMWINHSNDWIYPLLYPTAENFLQIVKENRNYSTSTEEVLKQAAIELLLAQSSDWPFIIKTKTTVEYAVFRVKDHVSHCRLLCDSIRNKNPHIELVKKRKQQYPLFSHITLSDFLL